jgi:hypothetical protein
MFFHCINDLMHYIQHFEMFSYTLMKK